MYLMLHEITDRRKLTSLSNCCKYVPKCHSSRTTLFSGHLHVLPRRWRSLQLELDDILLGNRAVQYFLFQFNLCCCQDRFPLDSVSFHSIVQEFYLQNKLYFSSRNNVPNNLAAFSGSHEFPFTGCSSQYLFYGDMLDPRVFQQILLSSHIYRASSRLTVTCFRVQDNSVQKCEHYVTLYHTLSEL